MMFPSAQKGSRLYTLFSVMQEITNYGPISRASLSKSTGLSKQTISEVVEHLESDGWVQATGVTSGHVGRTAVTYTVVPESAMIISVDLGGTNVRVSVADLACNISGRLSERTAPEGGLEVVVQIARMASKLAGQIGVEMERIMHVVVGVPGVPDEKTGRITLVPNIAGLDQIDFSGELSMRLGIAVTTENDINLAVLGEQWVGDDEDNLALLCVGTGVGAGIILDGNLIRGAHNSAGELGYLQVGGNLSKQDMQHAGSLENEVAAAGIQRRYTELSGNQSSVPEIFDLAAKGVHEACVVLDKTAQLLANAVAALCAVVDPKLVVFGGSIGQRPELVERVRAEVAKCVALPVQIRATKIEESSALLGGALLGLTKMHQALFAGGFAGVDINLPQPQLGASG